MWTISATARTAASAATVWKIYGDVAGWPRWDQGIARCQLDGAFAVGTTGILQPVGGPELPFTLILVEAEQRFADSTAVGPDTNIIVRHELVPLSDGTQITHSITIEGPGAEQMAQAFGFKQAELQETVAALARYAEGVK